MITHEIEKPIAARIDEMKKSQWIYNDIVVEILGYLIGVGEKGNDIEIYLNRGQTIYTDYIKVNQVLDKFHPIHEQARVLAAHESRQLSVCAGDVVTELRETLLDQIRELRTNPTKEALAKSKAINDTINQFTNLAKAELEYKKFTYQMKGGKK